MYAIRSYYVHQPFTPAGQLCQGGFGQHDGSVALLAAQLHCGGYGLADVAGGNFFARAKAHGEYAGYGKIGVPVQQVV